MKKLFIVLAAVMAVAMTGCKDDSPLTISVVPSVLSAPGEGGVYDVTVTASGYWSAVPADSMLQVRPSSGSAGETIVHITVAPATDTSERKSGVLFTCGTSEAVLSVTRSGLENETNYIKADLKEINAPAEGGYYLINIKSDVRWQATSSVDWVTLFKAEGQNDDSIAVSVSPNRVSTDMQSGVITVSEQGAPDNKVVITVTREGMVVKPAFKYAYFSVDSDKKVMFSPGNLQYQATTGIWRFAEFQYDIIGTDNANISDSYSGWIDLFGWGTGGNPTLYESSAQADYSSYYEWGNHSISNDDYDKPYYGQWVTLTKYEWNYLVFKRKNAASLFSLGTANGVPGAIVLPDDWQLPAGMSFVTSADIDSDHPFDANTYSASEWAVMEKAGAVFLPAAGHRLKTDVTLDEVDVLGTKYPCAYGEYWSSTALNNYSAYYFSFGYSYDQTGYHNWLEITDQFKELGKSVRLVYKEIVIN